MIMSHTTFDTSLVSATEISGTSTSPKTSFGHSFRLYLDAMREGIAASRRYDALCSQGITHEQALTRALAETGFGS